MRGPHENQKQSARYDVAAAAGGTRLAGRSFAGSLESLGAADAVLTMRGRFAGRALTGWLAVRAAGRACACVSARVSASIAPAPGAAMGADALAEEDALAENRSAVAAKPGGVVAASIKAAAQRPQDILSGLRNDIRAGFPLLANRTDEGRAAMAAGSLDSYWRVYRFGASVAARRPEAGIAAVNRSFRTRRPSSSKPGRRRRSTPVDAAAASAAAAAAPDDARPAACAAAPARAA